MKYMLSPFWIMLLGLACVGRSLSPKSPPPAQVKSPPVQVATPDDAALKRTLEEWLRRDTPDRIGGGEKATYYEQKSISGPFFRKNSETGIEFRFTCKIGGWESWFGERREFRHAVPGIASFRRSTDGTWYLTAASVYGDPLDVPVVHWSLASPIEVVK